MTKRLRGLQSLRTRGAWTAVDFVLLALLVAAAVFTIVAAVFVIRSNMVDSGQYRKQESRVSNVTKATTRCDTCVNRHVEQASDDDRDDVHNDDGDDDVSDGVRSLVYPDWWVDILDEPEAQQRMEDECPLVPAFYVIVTYKDRRGRQRNALFHEDCEMKENYRMHSLSPCERMDDLQEEDEEESGRSRDRRSADKGMRGVADRFRELLVSGESLTIYVDPEDPDQVVGENPHQSVWKSKTFVILFVITMILLAAFVIRRIVMRRKARKVDYVMKKNPPEMISVGEEVKQASYLPDYDRGQKERKEKDPAMLGPEVYAVPYGDVILHQNTLMTRGLADDVKMSREIAPLPPVYGDEAHVQNTPPPSYSSLDLGKY